ncbi:glycosyltransferase [Limosilactobacillus reuteri]|uniref:glycosyltransferase n=1 Tax=Limosilactobacillus reuteri TaxID=1598 RepID=UPI001583E847|nr:glycosyltransferase [Limosilactobacillus reuteri]QKT15260.1 glycosyltransferase [Limosilactobacillus reuteri]
MIFVTVGTHEQSFDRLLKEVDNLVKEGTIKENVIMQTGFSEYQPKNCTYYNFLSFEKMNQYIEDARIVITHGGPASFLAVIQHNKIPIVVPREKKYHEHINDHQVDFVKIVAEKMNNIVPIYDISKLKNAILTYDNYLDPSRNNLSNNAKFNKDFIKLVDKMFE